jgi:hypothetical protein
MGGLAAGPPNPPTLGAPRDTRGAPRTMLTGSYLADDSFTLKGCSTRVAGSNWERIV